LASEREEVDDAKRHASSSVGFDASGQGSHRKISAGVETWSLAVLGMSQGKMTTFVSE
jgi:hypothetical protein